MWSLLQLWLALDKEYKITRFSLSVLSSVGILYMTGFGFVAETIAATIGCIVYSSLSNIVVILLD